MDEIVGKTAVGPPAGFTVNDVDRCIWTYGLDPSRYLTLSVTGAAAHSNAIQAFGEGEVVPNLGQDARWWPTNETLSVLFGPVNVQVDFEMDEADVSRDLAVQIAQAALANLN